MTLEALRLEKLISLTHRLHFCSLISKSSMG